MMPLIGCWWRDDDDRCCNLTHSITQSLYHDLTHTSSLALLVFALSLSLSLTLSEITTSGSPSDDHCCPMTGKQLRLMMVMEMLMTCRWWSMLFISLTRSLTLSHSPILADSSGCWTVQRMISCWPMTGKLLWCCIESGADEVMMMMIDVVISLNQSLIALSQLQYYSH